MPLRFKVIKDVLDTVVSMKPLSTLALLASLSAATVLASEPEVYPVRFHMMHVHYAGRNNSQHGQGQANVSEDGQPTRGYDFTFANCLPFDSKEIPGELPARWTSKDHLQLVLLRTDLHSTKEECILRGTPRDFKYVRVDGKLAAATLTPPKQPEPMPQ
jgi:hypothetical protein